MLSRECTTTRDPKSPPCGQSRFTYWTCTVVRKDKSGLNLINKNEIIDIKKLWKLDLCKLLDLLKKEY